MFTVSVDTVISAGVAIANTRVADNLSAVISWFVGVAVTLAAAAMLVRYIRMAADGVEADSDANREHQDRLSGRD